MNENVQSFGIIGNYYKNPHMKMCKAEYERVTRGQGQAGLGLKCIHLYSAHCVIPPQEAVTGQYIPIC